MPDITPEINAIQSAIFGEEVRGSIIDALEKVNDDNESYTTEKAEILATADKLDALADTLATLNGVIANANATKTQLDGVIADAQALIEAIEEYGDFTTLISDVGVLQTDVSDLQTNKANASDVTALQTWKEQVLAGSTPVMVVVTEAQSE